eukprot:COSAG02_NODE_7249_length_3096_cov_5.109073_1_plen_138_part_00
MLAEVFGDGSRQLPPIGNLSAWTAAGPAALRAARASEVAGSVREYPNGGDESSNTHPVAKNQAEMHRLETMNDVGKGASDDESGLARPHDVEAAMALVKEIGYLPGTLGEHIGRMRSESEGSSAEVCHLSAVEITVY